MNGAGAVRGTGEASRHLIIVDAFDGQIEFLTDEPGKHAGARALGLPWPEIASRAACRITHLTWDHWFAYELRSGSPFTWNTSRPVTRPSPPVAQPPVRSESSTLLRRLPIPARDPEHGGSLVERGPGPMSHGMLAEHDALFWLSYCLKEFLVELGRTDPFAAVMLPMWGGPGYAPQLARAAGLDAALDVPFLVTVTDASVRRQQANQEGEWTRESATRRQMEDVSLALADGVLAFGPRGVETARLGRTTGAAAVVLAPRRIESAVIERIEAAAETRQEGALSFFLHEPQQPATGVLAALDAMTLLPEAHRIGFTSAGPDCIFAPMQPRTFRDYWSSRGHVRDLIDRGAWRWASAPEREGVAVRVHASHFEYLPDIGELARGCAALYSPAAIEGLCPPDALPDEFRLSAEPDAAVLARAIGRLCALGPDAVDEARRKTCGVVSAQLRSVDRTERIEAVADLLDRALRGTLPVPHVDDVLRLTLDRSRPLADADVRVPSEPAADSPVSLSVIITCYEMGGLVRDAVHSVWASERVPEELLLVDDGSRDESTAAAISGLEDEADRRKVPLRVIRQKNEGLASARNRGLLEAKGALISFLDGDDLIDPGFYRLTVPLMERFRGLGGAAGWARIFGDGVPAGGWFWNPAQAELPTLLDQNGVIVPCVMRTDDVRSLGGFDVNQRYNYEDWELSIRLLASGRPIFTLPAYLMRYRIRRRSLYRSMTAVQDHVMRGRMLTRHRETVDRFGVELALLAQDRKSRGGDGENVSLGQRIARAIPGFVRNVKAPGAPRA